jgi:hypothetical protein
LSLSNSALTSPGANVFISSDAQANLITMLSFRKSSLSRQG